ncbi:hypothetical protein Fmac_025285 [Flemingia macrophylla]|uniref:Uncharacterized protein n=1 Tax=Flemingia macrophylla TaxID=520843 RepID=A0ABD1LRT8_9FABA
MNPLCSSMIAAIFALTLVLSLAVIMSQARAYPSSSLVSQSSQSLSHSLLHREGKKSTEEPLVATSLRRIPPSRPNPTQNKTPQLSVLDSGKCKMGELSGSFLESVQLRTM